MSHPALPIESLTAWTRLNDVSLTDVSVEKTDGKGYGLVASGDLGSSAAQVTDGSGHQDPSAALVKVPRPLILSTNAVEEYTKENKDFRQLFEAVGHQNPRADILLFLLVQLVLSRAKPDPPRGGRLHPWTGYIQFLPDNIPLPTLWTEEERLLLWGTSLEPALHAKLGALDREFEALYDNTSDLPTWNDILWADSEGGVQLEDWALVDAWFRSRCLDLPKSGPSMVPCVDMVNHSATPSAYYEETDDAAVLLLHPGCAVTKGSEVTISYGDGKSAAEMLFSYGFIDRESITDSLVLPLNPFPDDPLGTAKMRIFGRQGTIKLTRTPSGSHTGPGSAADGEVTWESPFAYLMCLNEEDGLEFRTLMAPNGSGGPVTLQMFWRGEEATSSAQSCEVLAAGHELHAVFRLRAVHAIEERITEQLQRLQSVDAIISSLGGQDQSEGAEEASKEEMRTECVASATILRETEEKLLKDGLITIEAEKTELMSRPDVVNYLGLEESSNTESAASGQVEAGEESRTRC